MGVVEFKLSVRYETEGAGSAQFARLSLSFHGHPSQDVRPGCITCAFGLAPTIAICDASDRGKNEHLLFSFVGLFSLSLVG